MKLPPVCRAVPYSFFLLILAGAVSAQSLSIKPGLWEHTMAMTSETGQLEQALEQARQMLATMPPEQRAMMENMLKGQGIDFDFANQSFQNCVAEEEATLDDFSWTEASGCQQQNISSEGGATRFDFTCDNAEGSILLQSDEAYSGQSSMTMDFDGKAELVTVSHAGKWLGGDCGALVP